MANPNQPCFDDVQFHRFLESDTNATEEATILEHIGSCQQCQAALEQLAGHKGDWNEIKEHLVDSPDPFGEDTLDLESNDRNRDLRKIQEMLAPTDNPEMMGRLGGYEVCGMIGRGSAGVVVKALDTRLNRYVAIKLLAPVYSNNGSSRRRFEREGRAIASVKNPNVIPVHTVGEFQGTPYIVMQYVPDGSLQQRIDRKGPLLTKEVVCVAMQIAKGLGAAHDRGIVHRDVKPANVLMEGEVDCAMVTDFGLARVVDEATMTRSGAISGTPQYMSPEQAKGETVDPRSDLFSLGSVMYAMCTGHSPFRAESVFGVIKRVCDSEPRAIHETNPDIAPWLVAFIEKLHEKRRDDRFDSAAQVAELLRQELAFLEAPTTNPKPNRQWWIKPKQFSNGRKVGLAAVGALFLATVAGYGIYNWDGFTDSPESNKQGVVKRNEGGQFSSGSFASASQTELQGIIDDAVESNVGMVLSGMIPSEVLRITKQEYDNLAKFKNSVDTTIDVQDGGTLFLRSNLGTLHVGTHDKATVEMKLTHTIAAVDEETANKVFKAVVLEYALDAEEVGDAKLMRKRDAVIVAKFPTQNLTDEQVKETTELDELKEQFLIRNNSHFKNVKFELLVPKKFNLNLKSVGGPVVASDIDGWATVVSAGGHISFGSVSGVVDFKSDGGRIETGDLGGQASLISDGGHIDTGIVNGDLIMHSNGGRVHADAVNGSSDADANGGSVYIGHAKGAVKAVTNGGGITIWMAEGKVDANAPSGSVKVNFVEQPDGNSTLKSGNGSIKVGLAKGLAFDINASSGNGKVTSPFSTAKSNTLNHQLNDGGSKLSLATGNGSVKLYFNEENEVEKEFEAKQLDVRGERLFQKAYDLHMAGMIDDAIIAHEKAAEYEIHKGIATYNLGCAWALKNDKDKAFKYLNQSLTYGFKDVDQYDNDGDLDTLRDDPRFKKLMIRLKGGDKEGGEGDEVKTDSDENSNEFVVLTYDSNSKTVSQVGNSKNGNSNDCDCCPAAKNDRT